MTNWQTREPVKPTTSCWRDRAFTERCTGKQLVERLDEEYVAITAALKRLEERFDLLEAEQLARRVAVLERKVADLEKKPS